MTICAIDLETTSPDAATCFIREIALVPLDADLRPDGADLWFQRVVSVPGQQDEEAFRLHGLAPEVGDPWFKVRDDLIAWARPFVDADGPIQLLGHNIGAFDYPILVRQLGFDVARGLFSYRLRDTSPLIRAFQDADRLPKNLTKLGQICEFLGGTDGSEHRALPDAIAEAKLYARLLNEIRKKEFHQRELGTMLAALRLWQQYKENFEWEDSEGLWEIATDGESFKALSDKEIDQLCERLNS